MTPAASWSPGPAERARRTRTIVIAALFTAAVLAAAAFAWNAGLIGPDPGVAADDLDTVALIAAAPDDTGAVVAQVVTVLDLSGAQTQVSFVSPATPVAITGTTYQTLADAYPFGGGAGVADAYARAIGGDAPAYLAVGPDALARAVEAAGGVTLTLPADIAVFDGETLYTFPAGEGTFSADELGAVFKGAPYLTEGERASLDAELGHALIALYADWPGGGLMPALEGADITTTLSRAAVERVLQGLVVVR